MCNLVGAGNVNEGWNKKMMLKYSRNCVRGFNAL